MTSLLCYSQVISVWCLTVSSQSRPPLLLVIIWTTRVPLLLNILNISDTVSHHLSSASHNLSDTSVNQLDTDCPALNHTKVSIHQNSNILLSLLIQFILLVSTSFIQKLQLQEGIVKFHYSKLLVKTKCKNGIIIGFKVTIQLYIYKSVQVIGLGKYRYCRSF